MWSTNHFKTENKASFTLKANPTWQSYEHNTVKDHLVCFGVWPDHNKGLACAPLEITIIKLNICQSGS